MLVLAFAAMGLLGACSNKPAEPSATAAATVQPAPADAAPVAASEPPAPADGTAPTEPAQSGALNEVHGDWTVLCTASPRHCSLAQQLLDRTSRRPVLTLGFNLAPQHGLDGLLVMPLGLALAAGVTIQVDTGPLADPLVFHTCAPTGCPLALTLSGATVETLLTAKTLRIGAVGDDGQPRIFTVNMTGFGSALERVRALAP
jgi:invasion protein IalB